jgi:hypothetical protein
VPESVTREWKPFPKQEEFIRLPFSVFEALFGGSAGPGKSEMLLLLPLLYEFYKFAGFKGLILRRTYKELDEELAIRSQDFYPYTGGVYTGGNVRRWHWPEYGSYVTFGHAQHEKDIRNYDTRQYQYIGFDELTSFTEFQYLYMFSRCRSTIPGLPAIVRSATNPGNVGHGWVRKRFIEPYRIGGRIIRDLRSGEKRIYIHATVRDNPVIMKEDPGYIKRLEMLPTAERLAKLDGDWWTFTGQAFEDWRIEPLAGEPDNARHVVPAFHIPHWWPRILSIDWGHAANLWAGWLAISPDRRVYLYREYMGKKLGVDRWSTEIRNLSLGEKIVDVVLDWNAFQDMGEPETIAQQFQRYSGLTPRRADKGAGSRVSGKVLLQDYIRWRARPVIERAVPRVPYDAELAREIFRTAGQQAHERYCNQYIEEEAEKQELPRFQVFEDSWVNPHEGSLSLVDTIPLCVYDEKSPEDVAEFNGDDPYDGIRMGLRAVERWFDPAEKENKAQHRTTDVERYLSETGDWTGYYRRMEKLERDSEKSSIVMPVRTRRRRGRSHVAV